MKAKPTAHESKRRPGPSKTEGLFLRVDPAERLAFDDAADLAGMSLSAWIRDRLRAACCRELEARGVLPAFIARLNLDERGQA